MPHFLALTKWHANTGREGSRDILRSNTKGYSMGDRARRGKHVIKPWLPWKRGQDWSKEQLEGGGVGVGWGGAVVLWELLG